MHKYKCTSGDGPKDLRRRQNDARELNLLPFITRKYTFINVNLDYVNIMTKVSSTDSY